MTLLGYGNFFDSLFLLQFEYTLVDKSQGGKGVLVNLKWWRWILLFAVCVILIIIGRGLISEQEEVKPVQPRTEEVYGEFVTWKEVNRLFPQYANAVVTDCDTKMKFKVQRRAGSLHADVQPLTAADTAIMKKIYQQGWSWKRRAVIVEVKDGRRIAASMHGMPHGQGAIKGNNFNGHFCIHFRDSKVHTSRRVDQAHQMMVWKAAGVFGEQVGRMNQEGVIRVFFTAIEQSDFGLAARMIIPTGSAARALESFQNLESVGVESIELVDKNTDNTYRVKLLAVTRGAKRPSRQQFLITVHGSGEGSLYNFRPA